MLNRVIFFLLFMGVLVTTIMALETPELSRFSLRHNGIERTFFVHFPLNQKLTKPKPLVFVLHGGGGADANEMAKRTGMNRIADREDFVVVYPYGVDGQWNDGRGKTFRRAKDNTNVDDVGFIASVIDFMRDKGYADPRRVYAMGLSNGGMMTQRLGIEIGNRLAAIASVIANLPENMAHKRPVRPLPVLIMNGTEDPMMPWDGGAVRVLGKGYGTVLSTDQTVKYWVSAAGLPMTPKTMKLEDRFRDDPCTVELDEYRAANNPVEVLLYRLIGGGHNLPGGDTPDRPRLLGHKCMDIDGAEVIWRFFKRHTLAQDSHVEVQNPLTAKVVTTDWVPRVKQIGDPKGNYLNVEFTCDGRYMVWFEGVGDSHINGIVWHCGIDQDTGELIPFDCRGFKAFESTSWGRANPGCDREGPYYVGADKEGRLIMVRPEGPYRGRAVTLPTPPDTRRRAIYPTNLEDRYGGYILFIQNEKTPGAGVRANNNAWVELQYINLTEPQRIRTVERQDIPLVGFAPMDVGFVRWMRGRTIMTYGATFRDSKKVEIRAIDVEQPLPRPFWLIVDGYSHIDPYPALIGKHEYIFTGIDGSAKSHIYRRQAGQDANAPFSLFKTLVPTHSRLVSASLAQSHEPFLFGGKVYTVYQVNEKGRDFFDTTFGKPGELWLAEINGEPPQQWLIAPEVAGPVSEPEPLVTNNRVWVFYSRPAIVGPLLNEGSMATNKTNERMRIFERVRQRKTMTRDVRKFPTMQLYRAEVPLVTKE